MELLHAPDVAPAGIIDRYTSLYPAAVNSELPLDFEEEMWRLKEVLAVSHKSGSALLTAARALLQHSSEQATDKAMFSGRILAVRLSHPRRCAWSRATLLSS